ncbi:MAG TPA: hypothetical protein VFI42_05560 [Thermomicrobiaceae bacterium]|nr:hypothetical protein [Thermomicrobiaceae bacterium]
MTNTAHSWLLALYSRNGRWTMAQPHSPVTLEEVLHLVRRLSPRDQVRLIAQMAPEIERALAASRPTESRSLLGLLKDLGPAPSTEEIDAERREAWAKFPRPTP